MAPCAAFWKSYPLKLPALSQVFYISSNGGKIKGYVSQRTKRAPQMTCFLVNFCPPPRPATRNLVAYFLYYLSVSYSLEFAGDKKCGLLHLRRQRTRGRGWQRWGACVVGAGWGVRRRGRFSKSRPAPPPCSGVECECPARGVPQKWWFFARMWSIFSQLSRPELQLGAMRGRLEIVPFKISGTVAGVLYFQQWRKH